MIPMSTPGEFIHSFQLYPILWNNPGGHGNEARRARREKTLTGRIDAGTRRHRDAARKAKQARRAGKERGGG
jgi:hypothetical protein